MISIEQLLIDCGLQRRHSRLQIDSFITAREGGTLYGCLRQALRELHSRQASIRNSEFEIAKSRLKIKKLRIKNSDESDLRAEFLEGNLQDLECDLAETIGERDRFLEQVMAIRGKLEEQGIVFPIAPDVQDALDCEMWMHHAKAQATIELNSQGCLSGNTIKLLQCFPKEMKRLVCCEIFRTDAPQHLMKWFMEFETPIPVMGLAIKNPAGMPMCSESLNSRKLLPSTSPMDAQELAASN